MVLWSFRRLPKPKYRRSVSIFILPLNAREGAKIKDFEMAGAQDQLSPASHQSSAIGMRRALLCTSICIFRFCRNRRGKSQQPNAIPNKQHLGSPIFLTIAG